MPEKHQIDLAVYRIGKAKERLVSAEALLEAKSFADSIGRSYLCCIYSRQSAIGIERAGQQETLRRCSLVQ